MLKPPWFDRIIYSLIGLCVLAVMQLPNTQVRLQIIAANLGALFIGIWASAECQKKIKSSVMFVQNTKWFMRLLLWLHGTIVIGAVAVLICSIVLNQELLLQYRLWLKHLVFWLIVFSTLLLAMFVNPQPDDTTSSKN